MYFHCLLLLYSIFTFFILVVHSNYPIFCRYFLFQVWEFYGWWHFHESLGLYFAIRICEISVVLSDIIGTFWSLYVYVHGSKYRLSITCLQLY